MKPSTRATGLRWLLLCLLLLGVVSMHHFVATSDQHPAMAVEMTVPDHVPESPAHDLIHLCLAVLGAVAGLLLLVLLLGVFWPAVRTARRTRPVSRVDRPPWTSGRSVLTSVCVLRL